MNESLAAVIAEINRKYKRQVVIMANDLQVIGRLPTGSLALDVVLGGGWPVNRWTEIVGEASHGKTAILLKTIAYNQQRDPDFSVAWVAAEEYDKDWSQTLGVDNSRVAIIEDNVMENAFDMVLQLLDSQSIDMVVVDSLPALVPTTEDEREMGESTIGRGALLVNKFFRKALHATKRKPDGSERGVVGIVVNQWRMKIGTMYGDPRTTPGGVGKDYAFSIRCEVKRDEWLEVGTGVNKAKVGQRIRIRTIKNKTAPPQRSAFVDFYFEDSDDVAKGDYDYGREIAALAKTFGVVETKGAWTYYGDRKWQGSEALFLSLREELDLREKIEREVLALLRSHSVDAA